MAMPQNKVETPSVGKLHIDYAHDEQHAEFCQKGNCRIGCANECPRPTTFIPRYTEQEGIVVNKKLCNGNTFEEASCILNTWLDRGECNQKTSDTFFSMIQNTNSHVKRLIDEKEKYVGKFSKAEREIKQQMQSIFIQLNEIQNVFDTAYAQIDLDDFAKMQRENIEMWKKQLEKELNEPNEYMDVSDSDMTETSDVRYNSIIEQQNAKLEETIAELEEEKEALRCRIEAIKNENMVLRILGKKNKF